MNTPWDYPRERRLIDLRSDNYSFDAIASKLNCSRSAAIAKYHRLTGYKCPSDAGEAGRRRRREWRNRNSHWSQDRKDIVKLFWRNATPGEIAYIIDHPEISAQSVMAVARTMGLPAQSKMRGKRKS